MLKFAGTTYYEGRDPAQQGKFGPVFWGRSDSYPEKRWKSETLSGYARERWLGASIRGYGIRCYLCWLKTEKGVVWLDRELAVLYPEWRQKTWRF